EWHHVLVDDLDLVVGVEVTGERSEAERRKERVLDRAEMRARGFGERRQDQLDLHGTSRSKGTVLAAEDGRNRTGKGVQILCTRDIRPGRRYDFGSCQVKGWRFRFDGRTNGARRCDKRRCSADSSGT